MDIKKITILFIISFLGVSSIAQITKTNNFGETVKELDQKIELGEAKTVKALINIKGGHLVINEESKNLAKVKFEYLDEYWNPNISYTESNTEGKLIVKSNAKKVKDRDIEENHCYLSLNKEPNYSLGIDLGVGTADVNLANYNIDRALLRLGIGSFKVNLANTSITMLKVEAGIGEATFDLSGEWKNNLTASIKAGIGQVGFIVPKNVGVLFKIHGFLGEIKAPGFKKMGKTYINEAYNSSEIKLEFDVTGAIGEVKVMQK